MYVLDGTIANVSLPTIAGNLGASSSQSAWVITSFAASNAIALPLTGFLVRRIGQLRLFLWSMGLFTAASLACGMAINMEMLILCRVLQGAVAGPLIPTTQALMLSIYPPEKRGYALSMIAMVTVVAPVAGPLFGGWITDFYSWRWTFLINIPVGIFACTLVASQMHGRPESTMRTKVDRVGLVALILGVGALQILLDKGNEEDWFNSIQIVMLAIVAVVSLLFFVIWELTDSQPIVNLQLFRHRNFRVGTLALIAAYSAFYATNVIMPLWLQRTLGYPPIWAGLAVAPMGILPLLLMPFMGKYAPRFNMRWLVCGAFILLATASYLRSGFVIDIDFQHIALNPTAAGTRAGTVYHADQRHLALRPQAGRDCGRLRACHLYAYVRCQPGGLHYDLDVGSPCDFPSRPIRRVPDGLRSRHSPGGRDFRAGPGAVRI